MTIETEVDERTAALNVLIEAGGDLGKLASEALALKVEREQKAASEAELLDRASAGELDPDQTKEAARLAIRRELAETDAQLIAETKKLLRSQGAPEDEIARAVEQMKWDQAKVAAFTADSDPLYESEAFREAAWREHGREQAREIAGSMEQRAVEAGQQNEDQLLRWAAGDLDDD